MKMIKSILAATALLAAVGAQAVVTGSTGGGAGSFGTLSGPGTFNTGGTLTGAVSGTIAGGTVYSIDSTFADDVMPGANFLAVGPSSGGTATLTLTSPVSYISFLWGSPDLYNTLTVNSTGPASNSQVFTAAGLGFGTTDGNQSVNQAVQFTAGAGSLITSLIFTSSSDAFETANFTTLAPVPEPETYALMLAGLGLVGFIGKRRQRR